MLFPEEQKSLHITKEEVHNSVLEDLRKARNYFCQLNPSVLTDKTDMKICVIIEKPSAETVRCIGSPLTLETSYFSPRAADVAVSPAPHHLRSVQRRSSERCREGQQVGKVCLRSISHTQRSRGVLR